MYVWSVYIRKIRTEISVLKNIRAEDSKGVIKKELKFQFMTEFLVLKVRTESLVLKKRS